jgi:FkbM family methyltransferase
MISYAQAREDVLLNRAIQHVHFSKGFYIDVGGFDPNVDSVTKHFYEHGWRGINIEPNRDLFPAFERERTRDINLQVAVSDRAGEVTFHHVDNGQLGTLEQRIAEKHRSVGIGYTSYTVPAMTLAQICEDHVRGNIHFLKIDVEGHEAAVLRGMDFKRFRPWILVIEATEPNNLAVKTHQEWDRLVLLSGYTFAYTDGLNRYYVAHEHPSLLPHFAVPADHYVYAHVLRERDAALQENARLEAELREARRVPAD